MLQHHKHGANRINHRHKVLVHWVDACIIVFTPCTSSGCSCRWVCVGLHALGSGTCLVQGEWPEEDAIQHQQLPQWEYIGEENIQGAYIFRALLSYVIFPVCYVLVSVLGVYTHSRVSIALLSPHRTPWWRGSAASSWLMAFMSGGGRKRKGSPSSYTSLRLRKTARRKQTMRMNQRPQLAIRRIQTQHALQRRPPQTWLRLILGFLY